jgi:hypothetical protein
MYELIIKNRDAKTSQFPKLMLANEQSIVYNHLKDNQRILACPIVATGNLFMVINKLQGYPYASRR